jgi:hypothetical protein
MWPKKTTKNVNQEKRPSGRDLNPDLQVVNLYTNNLGL